MSNQQFERHARDNFAILIDKQNNREINMTKNEYDHIQTLNPILGDCTLY